MFLQKTTRVSSDRRFIIKQWQLPWLQAQVRDQLWQEWDVVFLFDFFIFIFFFLANCESKLLMNKNELQLNVVWVWFLTIRYLHIKNTSTGLVAATQESQSVLTICYEVHFALLCMVTWLCQTKLVRLWNEANNLSLCLGQVSSRKRYLLIFKPKNKVSLLGCATNHKFIAYCFMQFAHPKQVFGLQVPSIWALYACNIWCDIKHF